MASLRIHASLVVVSALAAACASGGPTGYPSHYSQREADIQQAAASRYDAQTIMRAQRALEERGFAVGPIDGIWGPSSQSALARFQRANGMTVDGRLGPNTLDALDAADTRVGAAGHRDVAPRRADRDLAKPRLDRDLAEPRVERDLAEPRVERDTARAERAAR